MNTDHEKRISELEAKVKQLTDIIAPSVDKTEINNLVRALGPDEPLISLFKRGDTYEFRPLFC